MVNRPAALPLVLALLPASVGRGQLTSGPEAGARAEPFRVAVAAGDRAGQEADLVAERKGEPAVYLFVRAESWDRPMARFLRTLDQELAGGIEGAEGASAVAIWLTDDAQWMVTSPTPFFIASSTAPRCGPSSSSSAAGLV